MRRVISSLLLYSITFSFAGCDEDRANNVQPLADFRVEGVEIDNYNTIETHSFSTVINDSKHAISYLWDFGNGTQSTEEQVELNYSQAGIYTITLTAINDRGEKSITSKEIRVLEKVLKQVVIKYLNWNSDGGRPSDWPNFTNADVWVEIKEAVNGNNYSISNDGDRDAPLIFKSQVFENVTSGQVPISILVSERVILHIPMLSSAYTHALYGINVYAKDATGTYLLSSTFWGAGFTGENSFTSKTFLMRTGNFGIAVDLYCVYED